MTQTVLILGASGRFGSNTADAFAARGWQVRRFDRARDDLLQAAQGAQVIVNGWNPAYPDWAQQVPRLHAQVQEVARQTGATVIVPGNVYVYGPDTPTPWREDSPHQAQNSLGLIRRRMEDGYKASGVRTILLRAGDFIDTRPSGNWFDMILTARLERGVFRWPGKPEAAHAWAYLPDLARAAVDLAEKRATLPRYCEVNFPGYTLSGRDMAAALSHVTGQPLRLRRMSMLPLRLASPLWPMGRCLVEMLYLWRTPHSLDGARFDALLPDFGATPVARALTRAVAHEVSVEPQIRPHQPVTAGR